MRRFSSYARHSAFQAMQDTVADDGRRERWEMRSGVRYERLSQKWLPEGAGLPVGGEAHFGEVLGW